MSVEGQLLEDLSEEELKKLLETASDYQERAKIRSALRKIKKSRGEITDPSKNADYKRRGHQIEVSKFKLDQPAYYGHVGAGGSNLRKEAKLNIPKPKHFIPSMMSPMVKRRDSEDMLSSEGSKNSLTTMHSYAPEELHGKDAAIRAHSYGFEQELRQHQSPDLGYPESPDPNTASRPSYSSEHTEESEDHTHLIQSYSEPQAVSPQSPQEDITLTESQLEQAASDANVEAVEQKMYSSLPHTHRSNTESNKNVPDAASQKADGELDQLTQELAYCDNPEEQVQLRKKIRETREIAGRGRMQKHTSFIQIEVKKGSKTESDSSSPQQSPSHALDEIDEQTHTPINSGEVSAYSRKRDASPAELSSSSVEELDTQNVISNEYSSDELEDVHGYPTQLGIANPYTDLTQLAGEEPLTGRRPRVKADGGIDFTNILNKSDNHLNSKVSSRSPIEQHSFKGVLRKNSPGPSTSPSNGKKTQEPMQMDFRNVLTNKVTTNQHKIKSAPLVASKPIAKNTVLPPTEYEESLPQQLMFGSEPLQRSPSPDQLPEPTQLHEHIPITNSNNCEAPIEDTVIISSSEPAQKENAAAVEEDEAALAYRRSSLKTGQDSRKRLRAMHKQNSLCKLRQSLTDIDIPVPSGDSIPEETSRTDPLQESDSPKIGYVEYPSPVTSPTKPASLEHVSASIAEPEEAKPSSYEQRRLERKKKRELSGRNTDDELQSQPVTERYSHARSRRENGETSSMKSAKDSYLKTAGINNDMPTTRSPTSSPNSHSSRTLTWAKSQTRGYNVEIRDLSNSWKDGLAFCALIHSYLPGEFEFDSLSASNPKENMELAFQVASNYGIPKLFDPEDILEMRVPDQRSIMTYLSTIYKGLHNQ